MPELVTMQSFDDNLMQRTKAETNYWNNCRLKEYCDRETEREINRHMRWYDDYAKRHYSQSTCLSYMEAIKAAIMDLEEAADKFWVMHCNAYAKPYRAENSFSDNKKWEDKEFMAACAERAANAAKALKQVLKVHSAN